MCKNRLQKIITGLYSSCVAHMATGFSSLNNIADSRLYSDMRFFVSVSLPIPALWRGVTGEPLRSLVSMLPVC